MPAKGNRKVVVATNIAEASVAQQSLTRRDFHGILRECSSFLLVSVDACSVNCRKHSRREWELSFGEFCLGAWTMRGSQADFGVS